MQVIGGQRPTDQSTPEPEPWYVHVLESGIKPEHIKAARIAQFPLQALQSFPPQVRSAIHSYTLPYFDHNGQQTDFYRIRLLPPVTHRNGDVQRYSQPSESGTHLYFPPPPMIVPNRWNRKDPVTGQLEPIFFTEGEKKALKGAQEGLLIIGLGGVANWHNHTFSVPWEDIKRSKDQKRAIIPQDVEEQIKDGVCPEFKNI